MGRCSFRHGSSTTHLGKKALVLVGYLPQRAALIPPEDVKRPSCQPVARALLKVRHPLLVEVSTRTSVLPLSMRRSRRVAMFSLRSRPGRAHEKTRATVRRLSSCPTRDGAGFYGGCVLAVKATRVRAAERKAHGSGRQLSIRVWLSRVA
ncbi:hypothetical protein BD626DRAFT_59072 [Schizophyllum amplum]|uniref:Uncharacterized protein n=1 Tax=Schizophyllum amplum TaxID=97359 RepID=A0A550CBT6_9AGAR|nr:hypothetical protein BD626DRAFT_59072 [Auriculariopsis ampla]